MQQMHCLVLNSAWMTDPFSSIVSLESHKQEHLMAANYMESS